VSPLRVSLGGLLLSGQPLLRHQRSLHVCRSPYGVL
jgi:hypothetical protein